VASADHQSGLGGCCGLVKARGSGNRVTCGPVAGDRPTPGVKVRGNFLGLCAGWLLERPGPAVAWQAPAAALIVADWLAGWHHEQTAVAQSKPGRWVHAAWVAHSQCLHGG